MASETSITQTIRRNLARHYGGESMKIHGSGAGRAGEPDLLWVRDGRAMLFEVKQPGRRATRLQAHRLDAWRAAGAVAEVVTSWADVAAVLHDAGIAPVAATGGRNGRG